jgi:hypothetical protein
MDRYFYIFKTSTDYGILSDPEKFRILVFRDRQLEFFLNFFIIFFLYLFIKISARYFEKKKKIRNYSRWKSLILESQKSTNNLADRQICNGVYLWTFSPTELFLMVRDSKISADRPIFLKSLGPFKPIRFICGLCDRKTRIIYEFWDIAIAIKIWRRNSRWSRDTNAS